MTTDEAERHVLFILGELEGTVREHIHRIEEKQPAVADAYWKAVFDFRVKVISEFEFLRLAIKQAKWAKDPG